MSRKGGGTGSPVWFRCSKCRSTPRGGWRDGYDVELTGRQRPARFSRGPGSRSSHIEREYRCRSCGHVGWSNHVDLARLAGEDRYLQIKNGEHHLPSYARPS